MTSMPAARYSVIRANADGCMSDRGLLGGLVLVLGLVVLISPGAAAV